MVRVIKDELLPDAVRTGVTKAIFENGDVSDYVLEELVGSIGVRADRAYEYAKRSYTHGLPSYDIVEASQGRSEIIAVLSQLEGGAPVSLEYSFFGKANFLHMGWMQLVLLAGYDAATNKILGFSNSSRPEVFLHDLEVCIPESMANLYDPSTLRQWGKSPKAGASPTSPGLTGSGLIGHTPIQVDPSASGPYWKLRYAWFVQDNAGGDSGSTNVIQESQDFFISSALGDISKDHFHVKYVVNGATKYWMYQIGLGTYPSLDALFNVPPKVTGSFFPFTYFRYDKKSEIEDKTSAQYKTTKRLAKYYGVNFDDVSKSIDENPDIADVQQAMMVMAIPANTENEVERQYLFTFFENWFYSKNAQYRTPAAGNIAGNLSGDFNKNVSSIVIQDKRFKMVLSCAGLYRRRVVGNIGKVGSHASGMSNEIVEVPAENPETGGAFTISRVIKNHYYRRQVSPTLYDEIIVADLKMMYYVYGEYTTTGDDTDDILLIPLDRAITEDYSTIEREELYARSLHFVFNSMKILKIKWYQQDWFIGIIQVIGMIISAITFSPQIAALVVGLSAGFAAAMAALLALLQKILQGIVVSLLFKLFIKAVGVDLAFLVAIVATIYGMAGTLKGSPIQGAPWASDFLRLGNGLVKAVAGTVSDLMKGLNDSMKDFQAFKDSAQKELDEANKLLETNNHLSPLTIFGESPNDFYNRTVHSGNAGINAITAVTNYVDMALTLPKLNETIGENAYGIQ